MELAEVEASDERTVTDTEADEMEHLRGLGYLE